MRLRVKQRAGGLPRFLSGRIFTFSGIVFGVGAALLVMGALGVSSRAAAGPVITLAEHWQVQSSAKIGAGGDRISQVGFDAAGWYPTSVPKTVFATLVENGVFKDPYFGMNLRSIPGVSYKIGSKFSNQEMAKDSPYAAPWWYRTEFEVPREYAGKTVWLAFGGINYRANIWVNGKKLAGSEQVAGAFRRYEFDVTSLVRVGETNGLAVEVFAPHAGDLAITFVDWNPMPPDKCMGLWQGVTLSASGPVAVRDPFVETKLDAGAGNSASLTVRAELQNASEAAVRGELRGEISGESGPLEFSQKIEVPAGGKRSVSITPEMVAALRLQNPRLWWPYQMGEPYLHHLALEFVTEGGEVSDTQAIEFGISQKESEMTPEGNLLLKVNGKPVLVRGAGWTPDMMLRTDESRRDADFLYVKDMGLNTIRLEGKLEDEAFFKRADRDGILILAGWCCCDAWEKWGRWNEEDRRVSVESLRDQLLRLRKHPSIVAWMNGSDNPPPADRERAYLEVEKEVNWPAAVISSATAKRAEVSGASGVKMTGPYEYVSPNYWLLGTKVGGAFGFNTETSPGPAVPPLEGLRAMFPADKLWPINEVWDFHAGGGFFQNIEIFARALEARYGKAKDVADFAWKSQAMTYEGQRAMFEAYGRNKYRSTGVIQWMLNNAWPSLIWHLYDYDLRPAGGYFGTKKALETVHVQFSYDDRTVAVVNGTQEARRGLKVIAQVYDTSMKERFSREADVEAGADGVVPAFAIPEVPGISTTYFLNLKVLAGSGEVVSRNFYWLSTKPDVPDFHKTEWYYTPLASFADFTALQELPKVELRASLDLQEGNTAGRVEIENPGPGLAFLVRFRLLGGGGKEILPVLWEDNYFSLLPGEKRTVMVRVRRNDLSENQPVLAVDGFNVSPQTVH